MLNYAICMAENGRSRTFLWIVIGGGALFLFVLAVFTLVYLSLHAGGEETSFASFGDKIGVVELEGVILDPSTVVEQIKKFGDDDSIKAIIIHVNSPGGGVAASEEIYREVKRVRDEKKSVSWLRSKPWGPAALITFLPPPTRFMPITAVWWDPSA